MLFAKSLRRELAATAGIVFSTLFSIMLTTQLVRLLGRASGGQVDPGAVLPLIAFGGLNYLPVVLVLTLFVSVLVTLSRAWKDSEMVVWFASGQSLLAWVRPVLRFSLPLVAVVGGVSLFVAPWANRQSGEYQQAFKQREDISQVAAGQFRESATANRVFFVEELDADGQRVRNVFVTQGRGDRYSVVVAASGQVEVAEDGQRYLVLEKGRRYDGSQLSPELRLTEFERYGLRLKPQPAGGALDSARQRDTAELLADPTPRHLGELLWRLGLPISALVLALLAIPLSFVNPRAGRSINLAVALLLYVLYSNLLGLMQAWVAQERLPFALAAVSVHLGALAVVAWLFARRLRPPRARRWLAWLAAPFARRRAAA